MNTQVSYEQDGTVAVATMDDGKANAISHELMDGLEAALTAVTSAVVLTGRAGRFCAGFDLREMMSGLDRARTLVSRGGNLLMRLYEFPCAVIARRAMHSQRDRTDGRCPRRC